LSVAFRAQGHTLNHHTLTYRPGDGTETVIRMRGDREIGEICNTVRDRLFNLSDEEKQRQALHADLIAEKYK
jgi:hypothetical protein